MTEPTTVSYSELSTFRDCPMKWHLAYRRRWVKPEDPSGPLARGSLWHAVMQAHYTGLRESRDLPTDFAMSAALDRVTDVLEQAPEDNAELVWWMYEGYIEHYRSDPQWKIVAIEHRAQVPLLDETGRPTPYHLKLIIDLVVRDLEGRLWLVDHKSAKDLGRPKELDLDDQFGLYTWGMRQLGRKVAGSIYSGARTQRNKSKAQPLEERFERKTMYRTDVELTNLALDAYRAAKSAYSMDVPYSSPDPSRCGWKCDFRDAHLLARKGVPFDKSLPDYGFERNPVRH